MEFPVVEKSEENLPMLFFQHLVTIRQNSNSLLFTKRLSATIIIFNPVEYLPNLWHGAPTYVLTPQGKWHIYMYYYTRSLPILIFKLSPLLEEDLNMRKMYKVILAYSPGAMQHNGLHIWELWDGDQKHHMNNWRRGRKTRQSYPIILLYKHYASTMLKRGRSLAIRNASDFFGCIINKPSSKIYILAPKYLTWMTRGLGLVSPFHNQVKWIFKTTAIPFHITNGRSTKGCPTWRSETSAPNVPHGWSLGATRIPGGCRFSGGLFLVSVLGCKTP